MASDGSLSLAAAQPADQLKPKLLPKMKPLAWQSPHFERQILHLR